jgi:hypothetical protein
MESKKHKKREIKSTDMRWLGGRNVHSGKMIK